MSIGFLALAVALFCAVISLYGVLIPQAGHPDQSTDYRRIYQAIAPRDL